LGVWYERIKHPGVCVFVCIVCILCYNSVQSVGTRQNLWFVIRQKPLVLKSTLSKTLLSVMLLVALVPPSRRKTRRMV